MICECLKVNNNNNNKIMSSLNDYKQQTYELCKRKGWDKVQLESLWMFFIEEIGELAAAIRRSTHQFSDRKKVNIEGEVMDVLSYLFQIAHNFDIDLDKAFEEYTQMKGA